MIYTCMTSDFFIEDADCWRGEAWKIMKARPDLQFCIVTKRIREAGERLPHDWGNGYDNVTIACTMENQRAVEERMSVFKNLPIKHKLIFCSPLLENLRLDGRLDGIDMVSVGGESGNDARPCRWEWVKNIYNACEKEGVMFHFHQTGSNFIKDGKTYRIPRSKQLSQAEKASVLLKASAVTGAEKIIEKSDIDNQKTEIKI